jgi:hypothetical protein
MLRLLALGFLLSIAGVAFVKVKDHDNHFCIDCHLHRTHFRTMVEPPPSTLAAAHFHAQRRDGHPERCFTCHSGEGVWGWSQVTLLSGWDAARWVAGDRHEPTTMRLPLTNDACLKCHANDVRGHLGADETSKFHELADHRMVSTPCVACHVVHRPGAAAKAFLDDQVVQTQCRRCHRDLGF